MDRMEVETATDGRLLISSFQGVWFVSLRKGALLKWKRDLSSKHEAVAFFAQQVQIKGLR